MDMDHVPARKNDIVVRLLTQIESGNIDNFAEGLPISQSYDNGCSQSPAGVAPPSHCQHVADSD